jgi:eukaryotic-like serine/threonine-protein kinase
MADTRPERIGRYEVLAELGQGAMGIVYKTRDPQLERIVAIKTLRRDLGLPPEEYADLRKRFYQEATAAGRLNHPSIVTIHDVVEIGDVPYIVMEFLDGRPLADLIASRGSLPPAEAVRLLGPVCAALDYAHAHGVVHRDIKPGNIMVGADGTAKIGDFGIARLAGSNVTRTGVVVGTPAYMAPEQLRGRVPDGRSDLFSLGVVLYEALTGANPFRCEDLTATLYQVVQVEPPSVREKNPTVPLALDRVVATAMAKSPDQRYPTARALGEALAAVVAGPPTPAGGTATVRLPAPTAATLRLPVPDAGRYRVRRIAAGGAACVVLAAVGWALWGPGTPREPAPTERPAAAGPALRPAAPPPAPARPSVVRAGEIVVATNPAVEVLVDGFPRGRAGETPLVIRDVAAGDRLVTLRLGSRQHEVPGTVRDGETWYVAYRFPDDSRPVPIGKTLEATGERLKEAARAKLREVLPEPLKDITRARPSSGEPPRPSGAER